MFGGRDGGKRRELQDHYTAINATVLHLAARKGSVKIIQLLLEYGANIDALDGKGRTPEKVAADCGHEEARQLLTNFRKK